jgi:hypothetical protein
MINLRWFLSALVVTTTFAFPAIADTPTPPPMPAKTRELLKQKASVPLVKPVTVRPVVKKPAPDAPSPVVVNLIAGAAPKVEGRSSTNTGVLGETSAKGQAGVLGISTHADSVGVAAQNAATESRAQLASGGAGVIGEAKLGTGVYGAARDTGIGVLGEGGTNGGAGVLGRARSAAAPGVAAEGAGGTSTALRVAKGAIRVEHGPASPAFVVPIDETTTDWGCDQRATLWSCGGYVNIDHPLTNGDPDVSMFFTLEGWMSGETWFQVMYWDGKWHVLVPSQSQLPALTDPRALDPRRRGNKLHVLVIKH